MDFGKWIIFAFVFFALFIGVLVTVCFRQDISLVSKEYYKEELVYQDQITRISNTNDLTLKPVVTIISSSQIKLDLGADATNVKIRVFCPAYSNLDQEVNAKVISPGQFFNINTLLAGIYRVKCWWTANGKNYYHEEVIYI
jgi:hypothetical protein